jgi:hypothetical protein
VAAAREKISDDGKYQPLFIFSSVLHNCTLFAKAALAVGNATTEQSAQSDIENLSPISPLHLT